MSHPKVQQNASELQPHSTHQMALLKNNRGGGEAGTSEPSWEKNKSERTPLSVGNAYLRAPELFPTPRVRSDGHLEEKARVQDSASGGHPGGQTLPILAHRGPFTIVATSKIK